MTTERDFNALHLTTDIFLHRVQWCRRSIWLIMNSLDIMAFVIIVVVCTCWFYWQILTDLGYASEASQIKDFLFSSLMIKSWGYIYFFVVAEVIYMSSFPLKLCFFIIIEPNKLVVFLDRGSFLTFLFIFRKICCPYLVFQLCCCNFCQVAHHQKITVVNFLKCVFPNYQSS